MAQSVKHLTSAQVMISLFVGSSPASGSVLIAQSLEPASDSVSPSLSKINKHWDAWVAQSLKRLTLDFGTGCDLTVCEFEPHIRLCAGSA